MIETVVFSAISFAELLTKMREIVREEIKASQPVKNKQAIEYLSRQEVAAILHISLPTLNELTKTGRVKGYRIGRRVLYKSNEIDKAIMEIK